LVFGGPEYDNEGSEHVLARRPKYRLAWAVSRSQPRLFEFLREAFKIFLDSNTQIAVDELVVLRDRLQSETERAFVSATGQGDDWRGRLGLEVDRSQVAPTASKIVSQTILSLQSDD